jgi:galactokinase
MWRYEGTTEEQQVEMQHMLDLLDSSSDFFEMGVPIHIARAPGRLDVIGGIADYSGSLVLEMPLAAATLVAIQPAREATITIVSTAAAGLGSSSQVILPLAQLCPPDHPLDYLAAHQLLTSDPQHAWAA